MRIFNRVSKVLLATTFTLGFVGPIAVFAATAPTLGTAGSFGVLSSTFTNSNTAPQTIINGDVGYTVAGAPVTPPLTINGNTHPQDATWTSAGIDQGTSLTTLNTQSCTTITGPLNATIVGANSPGVFPPGCYETTGAMLLTLGTSVTLDLTAPGGVGSVWIFRAAGGGITTGADSFVTLANGASACNVFWTASGATNIGAYTGSLPNTTKPFIGTIIDDAGIGLGHFAVLLGRALAFNQTVTTDANTITVPSCAPVPPVAGRRRAVPPLISVTKIPTPLALPLGPATTTYNYNVTNIGTVAMSNVTVSDNKCATTNYLSGDVNNNSQLDLTETWKYSCSMWLTSTTTNIVTATGEANGIVAVDTAEATVVVGVPVIPPLIHVVKVPNIFLLPAGGGPVTYNYTVTNPGTAPLSNVSVTDDKCTGLPGLVVGNPGDINHNNLLESNESWAFTCQTNITDTVTNTVTARGSANGLTAYDYALATVVVSAPILPNTGLTPLGESTTTDIIVVIIVLIIASYIVMKNRKM
jgi:hypothetical protein